MVWFQCEDCGDNLKKPKLPNHFRTCSASKLSCIDCGQIFGQDSVQQHTQCITEAEKYGPKGQSKTPNVTAAKPNGNKQKPEVDIHVGLSERPPWFCSLCNTKATSKQTLLLHADGKKHRAKARAFHSAKQQPLQTDTSASDAKLPVEHASNDKVQVNNNVEQTKFQDPSKHNNLKSGNESSPSNKKRISDVVEDNHIRKKGRDDSSGELGNGEVVQAEGAAGEKQDLLQKERMVNDKKNIKWKKFIISALRSQPDAKLKMKKLRKHVLKALQESGVEVDETELSEALERKINSSSRFAVEKKYVRLVPRDD
ncbi:UBP1-associated proteins 1C [Prosopis cineraria]|uniref:UBP1-associated proteins 1C n=1 Tax=Prosopis cineraria TaxID=364024 RepID=UPI00241034D5|nr:UBP1-associated proteins 1C [Prosopis cineraria]